MIGSALTKFPLSRRTSGQNIPFDTNMRRLLALLLIGTVGCASLREVASPWLTDRQRTEVIAKARALALDSGILQQSERSAVETRDPKLAYYFTAGVHSAQYCITWRISDGDSIQIYGDGDMLDLKGAKLERLFNQSVQRTGASRFAHNEKDASAPTDSRR